MTMGKKILIGAVGALGAVVIILLSFSSKDLGLELKSTRALISIRNIGQSAVQILDITINDRKECTTVSGLLADQNRIEDNYSNEDRHRLWVAGMNLLNSQAFLPTREEPIILKSTDSKGRETGYGISMGNKYIISYPDVKSIPMKTLQIGDEYSWMALCNSSIVRATITTDRGSETYTFSD